jgi:hypothetical protein
MDIGGFRWRPRIGPPTLPRSSFDDDVTRLLYLHDHKTGINGFIITPKWFQISFMLREIRGLQYVEDSASKQSDVVGAVREIGQGDGGIR